jgi:hypothetical protein
VRRHLPPHQETDYLLTEDSSGLNEEVRACAEARDSSSSSSQQLDLGHLCQELETKCLISRDVTTNGSSRSGAASGPLRTAGQGHCPGSPHRARSYSETAKAALVQTVNRKVGPIVFPCFILTLALPVLYV